MSSLWAAGVFIRETRISCIVGEIDPDRVVKIGSNSVPSTRNRETVKVADVDCESCDPREAIRKSATLLLEQIKKHSIDLRAIHIACFGGFASTNPEDKGLSYGLLKNVSAYKEWENINIYLEFLRIFQGHQRLPQIDVGTDVDAAAFGEFILEIGELNKKSIEAGETQIARQELIAAEIKKRTIVCLNFSRNINGGIVRNGEIWAGSEHPSMSIIRPPRFTIANRSGGSFFDLFKGTCKYHSDCIEGLIGVGAIEKRFRFKRGSDGDDVFKIIDQDHVIWDVVAYYIAQMCIYVVGILKPSKIVLIGRTTRQLDQPEFADNLVKRVRGYFYSRLTDGSGNYSPNYPELLDLKNFISLPTIKDEYGEVNGGGKPGRHGALRLAAIEAYRQVS